MENENDNSKRDSVEADRSQSERIAKEQEMRVLSLSRNPSYGVRIVVNSLRTAHVLIAFAFLVLALVEFIRSPPYFDALADKEPIPLKPVCFNVP